MASFIMNKIPEAAWKSMGIELVNQVCNITYYDKTNGDDELKRHPKREILNIITDFLQNNINLREANVDESFKADFFKNIAENMKPPIAKMYENDLMAIRLMEAILKEYPYIFMNIINVIAQQTSDEASEKKEPFITLFMKKITTYTNVENEVSQNINKDTELSSPAPENHEKLYEIENEDISGVQDTLVTTIKKYGYLKNADNIDHLNKVSNDEVIKHIDSLIDTIVTTSEENNKTEAPTSALSTILNNNLNINPVAAIVKEAIGDMPKEFVEKIFATLEKSDAKQYSEIKKDIYKTILSALRYHLERPEGRQMYLRQLEPIVRNYAVKTLMNDDITVLCIFQLIRDSPKINTFLKKTVEMVYKNKNNNFTNPSFQDMRKFTGGAMPNPFKVFREKTEPFVNKVLGKKSVPLALNSPTPDSLAPDSPALIDEPYDISKIISEYKNTFAYDVYQLLDAEIQTVIKGNDPIAKMYNDLEQFNVPKLAKLNKNAIDYAKTMCSPGIMKKEIEQGKSSYRKTVENPAQTVENPAQTVENPAQTVEPITGYATSEEMSGMPPALGDSATPTNVADAQKQAMSGVEDIMNQGKDKFSGLYKTATNVADTQNLPMPSNAQNLANNAMSFFSPKKGGNIHKTYRKMTQKRHKYTRKT